MKVKLIAIWKILTNNYWFLFTAKGDVTGSMPTDIAYMQSLIEMANRFKDLGVSKVVKK